MLHLVYEAGSRASNALAKPGFPAPFGFTTSPGNVGDTRAQADWLGDAILSLPAAEGVARIFLPGERGASVLQERERAGIPLPRGTWRRLLACAQALGVRPPELLA
jgi:ureidoglycolate dehydrogenase (NAD+)